MPTPRYAVATLLYTTEYLPGVFTLGYQLKKLLGDNKEVATCLVISKELYNISMSELSKSLLRRLYDYIYEVDPLDDQDSSSRRNAENLSLLGRPELSFTLIKARLWELTQFDQVLYLDGDTLPLSEDFLNIFGLLPGQKSYQIGGAPDIGWPDMFNSGVLMLSPDKQIASQLQKFIKDQISIDGADQGILNQFFNPYCAETNQNPSAFEWLRLPFIYNVTMPNYGYQSSPALKYFKAQVKLVHFIGENKPWKGWSSNDGNVYFTRWNQVYSEFQQEYGLSKFFEEMSINPASPAAQDTPTAVPEDDGRTVVDWEKLNERIMQSEPKRNDTYEEGLDSTTAERTFPKSNSSESASDVERVFQSTDFLGPKPHEEAIPHKSDYLQAAPRSERVFPAEESPANTPQVERTFPDSDPGFSASAQNNNPTSVPRDAIRDRDLRAGDDEPTREIAIASEVPVIISAPASDPGVERVFPGDAVGEPARASKADDETERSFPDETTSAHTESPFTNDDPEPLQPVSEIGRVLEMIKEESEESSMPDSVFQWEKTDYLREVERTFPD